MSAPGLTDEVRREAFAYVDAVLARADGVDQGQTPGGTATHEAKGPSVARLVPGALKRAVVRTLVYVMRHPFDHLSQPLQIQLEEEIGRSRGIAQAALTRAEQMAGELRRLRAELDKERRPR